MAEIKLRQLGKSSLMVSPIGLGCWQFSGGSMAAYWNSPPQEEIDEIVRVALEGGINWFDTAEMYGFGRSEHALSVALQAAGRKNGDVIIATKWNPILRRASNIARTFPARERHLAPFQIDLFQVHLPYSVSSVEAQMNALADLLDAGKIKTVGVSNFSEKRMRRAQKALRARGYSLASNQVRYNLLDRSIEKNGIMTAAKELNISLIAYSPLAQGLLGGKYHQSPDAVRKLPVMRRRSIRGRVEKSRELVGALIEIAQAHDVSASQVALNWLVNFHGDTVVAIPGATRSEQAKQNCGAMNITLSDAQMSRIDELSRRFI
jgi:aryl-alcohol dehydrogenase-like predicted oxidoreductase